MIERLEPVAEVIVVLPDEYLIAAFAYAHSRQAGILIRLPLTMLIPHVFRLADFTQVLDAVVEAVAIDMVYLHRGQTPVVPCPDYAMHEDMMTLAIDVSTHQQITMFTVSFTVFLPSHHAVRLGIHKLSAAVVVVIVLLDASHQCGQLAIR